LILDPIETAANQIKNALLSGLMKIGPGAELCADFYKNLVDPIIALIDGTLAMYYRIKDKYLKSVSIVTYFDELLTYWTATKAFLNAMLLMADDALHQAMVNEAAAYVP
jgi:hypothetical protein